MRGQPEPEQGSTGLGKKVEDKNWKPEPKDDWEYLGNHMWRNKLGQRHYCPPAPREWTWPFNVPGGDA